jgi:hypothetical protein
MRLVELQIAFTRLVPKLIVHAEGLGFEPVIAEVFRPQLQAAYYAKLGKGIKNSLHCDKLAIDLLLFARAHPGADLIYLDTTESYAILGSYWKSLDSRCRWGGDFASRPDGNHFSLTPDGRA